MEEQNIISSIYGIGNFDEFDLKYEIRDQENQIYHFQTDQLGDDLLLTLQGNNFLMFFSSFQKWMGVGDNTNGQMDIRNGNLLKISNLPHISSIESKISLCGEDFIAILGTDNQIYATGARFGQTLNQLESSTQIKIISILDDRIAAIGEKSGLFIWSSYQTIPVNFCRQLKFIDISSSHKHLLALQDTGIIFSFIPDGNAPLSLCGRGDHADRYLLESVEQRGLPLMKKVFATPMGSFAIDNKNQIWAAGENINGLLGIGSEERSYVFQQIKSFSNLDVKKIIGNEKSTFILCENGELFVSGQVFFTLSTNLKKYLEYSNVFIKCDFFEGKKVIDVSLNSNRIIIIVKEPKPTPPPIITPTIPINSSSQVQEKKSKVIKSSKQSVKSQSKLPHLLDQKPNVFSKTTKPNPNRITTQVKRPHYADVFQKSIVKKVAPKKSVPNITVHYINF